MGVVWGRRRECLIMVSASHAGTKEEPNGSSALSALRVIVRRARESGLMHTVMLGVSYSVPEKVFRFLKMSVWETRLDKYATEIADIPNVRWVTPDDRRLLKQAGYEDSALDARFALSCRAAICLENGELVGICWFEPNANAPWENYQVTFDLPRDGFWIFDAWVSPAHRGKGTYGNIKAFALSHLRAAGHRCVHSIIVDLNRNSKRASQKSGGRRIGSFLFIRFLNFVFFRTQGSWHLGRYRAERKFPVVLQAPTDDEDGPR